MILAAVLQQEVVRRQAIACAAKEGRKSGAAGQVPADCAHRVGEEYDQTNFQGAIRAEDQGREEGELGEDHGKISH